jgi:hypothetical protein
MAHCTHRRLVIALPSVQLASGLNDPSIEACTMGTLFFAEHATEWDEDAMVQAGSLETLSVCTTGFILCRQTSAHTSLRKEKKKV